MKRLRLAFFGTPDFAVPILEALLASEHLVTCVYAKPALPSGRGLDCHPSSVQKCALNHGLEVRTPATLGGEFEAISSLRLDAAVVAAYGLLIPEKVLKLARLGFLNVHPSLLPRWRGPAPMAHAILAGDRESGVTLLQLDAGIDSGPLILQQSVAISSDMTAAALQKKLLEVAVPMVISGLAGLDSGSLTPVKQPEIGLTYAPKLSRAHGWLNWSCQAVELERKVRALIPWPGTHFQVGSSRIKVWAAEAVELSHLHPPGCLIDRRLTVACGQGALRLQQLQREGRSVVSAADFLRGFHLEPGTVLQSLPGPGHRYDPLETDRRV